MAIFGYSFKTLMYGFIGIMIFIIAVLIILKKYIKAKSKKVKISIDAKKEIELLVPYNYIEEKKGLSLHAIREKWTMRMNRSSAILINMELNNGDFMQFVANIEKGHFKFAGKTYIIDVALQYYLISARMYCLDYHESFTMPIKRRIPIKEIQKSMTSSKLNEEHIFYATNPKTLENFLTSSTIEKILSGGQLDAWLRQCRLLLIIILFVVVIHMLLFVFKTGMLSKIHL